ncbi:MAG: site-specific DNA-methyltransferase [Candidatus Bathyarchaeota archaeon]
MLDTVSLGDCLDLIYKLPHKSVDLIFTDPPYNICTDRTKMTAVHGIPTSNQDAWGDDFTDSYTDEEYSDFMSSLCDAYDYVLKDDGSIITFFDKNKPQFLSPFYDRFTIRNTFAFIKTNPPNHFRMNNYRSGFEQCAWFSREKYRINFISQSGMINVFYGQTNYRVAGHPTEKLPWMVEPLILRHTNEGDTVLDPMCGSGTMLVYAKKHRRQYIGFDIEPKYVDMSLQRLADTHVTRDIRGAFR